MRFNEGPVSARKGLTPLFRVVLVIAALVALASLAGAQTPAAGQATAGAPVTDTLSGSYKGTAKSDPEGDIAMTLELQNQAGKLSGQVTVHDEPTKLTDGSFKDGHIALKFMLNGSEMTIAGELKDANIVGTWTGAGRKGSIELKKVPPTAATPVPPATTAANGDAFTGDWDAVADANGQSFPFALTLKIDGEKVTGGSSSELGQSTIGAGTFKDGRVTFRLDGQAGAITMTAVIQEGKLVGDFDYSGQMQGRWVAVRHKP